MNAQRFDYDVTVVGGAGHVGLPLAIAFAARGLRVCIYDINTSALELITAGELPFLEPHAEAPLREALAQGTLVATGDIDAVTQGENVIVVVGTPVDEHLSPDPSLVLSVVTRLSPQLRTGQMLVLRSTVYPGVTARVEELLRALEVGVDVSFCPERIAEGRAMTELFALPQIVSARTESARQRAASLFGKLTHTIVEMSPEEAELAKLFTNSWRYIKFAAANQFFMMATDHGLDYERIRAGLALDYPRAADLPGAGFAAGPCLFKDTMQLAAFADNAFVLGHSAMLVNEGLPQYIVGRVSESYDLGALTVGILGMAFKGESDDTRSSLSYKLKRILTFKAKNVITADPYVTTDPELLSEDEVLREADLVVIGAPHAVYQDLKIGVPIIDVWGLTSAGSVP